MCLLHTPFLSPPFTLTPQAGERAGLCLDYAALIFHFAVQIWKTKWEMKRAQDFNGEGTGRGSAVTGSIFQMPLFVCAEMKNAANSSSSNSRGGGTRSAALL